MAKMIGNGKLVYLSICLSLTIGLARATVIGQSNKRVLAAAESSGPRLFYIKASDGLLQSSSPTYLATGEFESGDDALAVDYHYPADLLFWTTRSGHVYSCGLSSTRSLAYVPNPQLVYSDTTWLPASLAVDHLADRIYVLDTHGIGIRSVGLNGSNLTAIDLPARNFKPLHLEIDPHQGYAFLVDYGEFGRDADNHIMRMNIDGSEPRFIEPREMSREFVIGKIALDRPSRRVLVSSVVQGKIFSIDYDGGDLRTIAVQQMAISMSLAGNELYWINAFQHRQGLPEIDGSAYKCAYDSVQGCRPNSTMRLTEELVMVGIKAIEPMDRDSSANACSTGSCQQLCYSLGNRSSCGCEIGWQLDGPTGCRRIDEFVVYEDNSVIRAACATGRCKPFAPFHVPLSFKKNERTGFDYDPTTRQLYIGGRESIYQVDLDTGARRRLLYQKDVFFGPLAIDRSTKNLYYTEIEQRGSVSFYLLKVAQAGGGSAQRAEASSTLLWELGPIHTIAVHPSRGLLYVTAFNYTRGLHDVWKFNTDGKNATIFLTLKGATFMSIDERENRIYVFDNSSSEIRSADLEIHEVRRVGKAEGGELTGLLARDGIVYVQNRTSLRRIEAASEKELGEIDIFPYDQSMRAGLKMHFTESPADAMASGNPCERNNGGCDNFCFAVPRFVGKAGLVSKCRCFDGVKCADLLLQ